MVSPKGAVFVASETSLVKALVKFKRQQLPFVDLYTGAHTNTRAHTNTIEGVWNAVKKKLKRMCGTFKHHLPSYLDEFNWQRVYPGERFEMMLQHIGELYPVH